MARVADDSAVKEQGETTPWIIDTRAAGRSFGRLRALQGIDLQVGAGEIFGILGPDGAGKTTLMQMLAAILDPTEGQCRVLGFDSVREADSVTARIGYMSQGFTLYDRLSVDENLRFAARIRDVSDADFPERRARLLDMARLSNFGNRRAGQLSGGMRKKLSLCTNLIHEPPLLLLDELSLGVDPVSRRELWRMLRAFRERGVTVVLTTPYMDEAAQCDRLAFLCAGRLLAAATPAALRARARGTVYEIRTERVGEARVPLAAHAEVIGQQWFPGRLRIQIASRAPFPESLKGALAPLGVLREVEPDLENAFVAMVADENRSLPVPASEMKASQFNATESRFIAKTRHPHREAVSAAGVTVRFGNFTAVDAVSVTIAPGEVVGWLGPNGAGKTTFMRVLCGLLTPTQGQVRVAGLEIPRQLQALKQRIGYMSQRFSLYPDLTVGENLAFFAGVYGLSGAARREAMAWSMATTGLAGTESRRVGALSGAQRQRLALACAVMHQPGVLFLDEPTSGVDPLARQRFWQLIQELAASGMAVLVTTHYLEEARYCHRLGLMDEGRLIALGAIEELRAAVTLAEQDNDIEAVFMAHLQRARQPTNAGAAA